MENENDKFRHFLWIIVLALKQAFPCKVYPPISAANASKFNKLRGLLLEEIRQLVSQKD